MEPVGVGGYTGAAVAPWQQLMELLGWILQCLLGKCKVNMHSLSGTVPNAVCCWKEEKY